jgi:hypothetical protein
MEYSGSRYDGPQESGRAEGVGTYVFPNGTRYVGGFKNGMFDGEGTMYVPGCGAYTAQWSEGRKVAGSYTFADGLAYEQGENWDYCTPGDRRFRTERQSGIRPAGEDQLTNNIGGGVPGSGGGDPRLEHGQADTGDGYVELRNGDGQVRDFKTGETLRYMEDGEKSWLQKKCRIGPSGEVGRDVDAALRSLFLKNDVDGKDSIERAELANILLQLGKPQTEVLGSQPEKFEAPSQVLAELGKGDRDATLSLDAWINLWSL